MLQNVFATHGPSILMGGFIIISAWFLALWTGKLCQKWFMRTAHFDATTAPIAAQAVRITILVLVSMIVLDEYGVDMGTLIAALSIFGFAVAIGMRPTATNFFTGIMLISLKPFKVGDYIEVEKVTGLVESLHVFHTVIVTEDGNFVSVPNGAVWAKPIKNFSRPRPVRVELHVVVEDQLSFREIAAVIDGILRAEPNRKKGMETHVAIVTTEGNTMTVQACDWCDAEHGAKVRTGLSEKLREGITAAGATVISIEPPKKEKPKKKAAASSGDDDA